MSDGFDPGSLDGLATHIGGATAASGLGAALMAWIRGKESREVATRLAVIEEQLKTITAALAKHGDIGERVALLEQSVKALHDRLDGKRGRR